MRETSYNQAPNSNKNNNCNCRYHLLISVHINMGMSKDSLRGESYILGVCLMVSFQINFNSIDMASLHVN